MTPLRVLIHIKNMCESPLETPASIRSTANSYRTAANASKEYDIEWYAIQFIAVLDALVAAAPNWGPEEIKLQLSGRIGNLIPGIS